MQNPSRRAFFGGRPPELSAWDQCIQQLQRRTQAKLRVLEQGEEQAVLTVQVIADLHHARQLCHVFGVSLYLWGTKFDAYDMIESVVWIDMSELDQLMPIDEKENHWFMQGGVRLEQLKGVGFDALKTLPDKLMIANWLADAQYHRYPLAHLSYSGLIHASLLMADGSVSSLGAFGAKNTKPLNTATLRQIVPKLFQLASSEIASELLSKPYWLGRYRLDIFHAQNQALNLAHLLLGHGGDLGILEWVVISKSEFKLPAVLAVCTSADPLDLIHAQELDAAIKHIVDPESLFSSSLTPHDSLCYAVPQHVLSGTNE